MATSFAAIREVVATGSEGVADPEQHAQLRELLVNADDALFQDAAEAIAEPGAREAVRLCFMSLRPSSVEDSQHAVHQQLPHDHLRLDCARQRLSSAVTACLRGFTSPLPAQAHALSGLLLEELQHMCKEELLAVVHAVLSAFEAGVPSTLLLLGILPTALKLLLDNRSESQVQEAQAQVDHSSSRDSAIQRLCSTQWPSERAAAILDILQRLPLTPAQASLLVTKAYRQAITCELQAIPVLVHQILLLPRNLATPGGRGAAASSGSSAGVRRGGTSLRVQVMRGLISLMDQLASLDKQKAQGPVLLEVSGVVLQHVASIARHDLLLIPEWLDSLEAGGWTVGPAMTSTASAAASSSSSAAISPGPGSFLCLLLCSLCSPQQQLAPKTLAVVKALLLQMFTAEDQQRRGSWEGSEMSSTGVAGNQGGQQLAAALVRAVSTASRQFGELVAQGALELGSLLMNALSCGRGKATGTTSGALPPGGEGMEGDEVQQLLAVAAAELRWHQEQQRRRRLGRRARQPAEEEAESEAVRQLEAVAAPRVRCCLVGMRLVAAVLEEHEGAREEVMRRVIGALQAAPAAAAAAPNVLLLGMTVRRRPRLLLPLQAQLQDLLEQLPSLPCEASRQGLLLALWPVLRSRRVLQDVTVALQDVTVALLRKVMFSREVSLRLLAVGGFLHLILDQLQAAAAAANPAAAAAGLSQTLSQAGSSQSTLSQMGSLSVGCGVSLLSELTGFLRRALSQQAAVRAKVYEGLTRIVTVDPGSLGGAAELLMPHAEQYLPAATQHAEGQPCDAPLHLSKCTECKAGEVRLSEDLPALIACMQSLVNLAEAPVPDAGAEAAGGVRPGQLQDSDPSEYFGTEMLLRPPPAENETALTTAWARHEEVQALVRAYHDLRQQVVCCDAAQWGFEASAEWYPGSVAGAARQLQASCLLGCVEVLMEGEVERASRSGGWNDAARQWMASALALHRSVSSMSRNTKAPAATGVRKKAVGKENRAGEEGPQASGTAQADGVDGSQDGVGDATAGARTASKGKAGPAVKAVDLVKVDERQPTLSPACLAHLAKELSAAVAPTDNNKAQQEGLGDLARRPSFASFVLRRCLNLFRHGHSTTREGDLLRALSDVFATSNAGAQPQTGCAAATGTQPFGTLAGPALAACWAVIGSAGSLGCSAEELEADAPADAAADATAQQDAGNTSQQGPAAGGKRTGWGKRGKAAAEGGEDAATAAGLPPTGKKAKRAAPADPDGSNDARVLLAARLAKTILEAARTMEQLAETLQPLPALQPSKKSTSQTQPSGVIGQDLPPWPPAGSSWSGPLAVAGPRLLHLYTQLQHLMKVGSFEAAQTLVESIQHVGRLLPPQIRPHLSDWVYALVCQHKSPRVEHEGLAKASISACSNLGGPPRDLELLVTVATDVQRLVGATGQLTQTQHDALPILHESVAQQVAGGVLSMLRERLQGMDLGFAGARALADNMTREAVTEAEELGCWRGLRRKDLAAYLRLEQLMQALSLIVNTRLGLAPVLELQACVVVQAYKVLTAVAKHSTALAAASPKGTPCPRELAAMVLLVNRDLTPSVYSVIQDTQAVDQGTGQARAFNRKRAAAIKKEQKNIPAIIFQVETWEKQLLALSKACGSNMLKGAKRTINRDFKLDFKEQEEAEPEAGGEAAPEPKPRGKKRAQKDAEGAGGRKSKKGGAGSKGKDQPVPAFKMEEDQQPEEGDEEVVMVDEGDEGAGMEEGGYGYEQHEEGEEDGDGMDQGDKE